MIRICVLLLVSASFLASCSNVKPYQTSANDNFFITSETDSDVTAEMDVYSVGNNCKLDYQGTLALTGEIASGLFVNKLIYLRIRFSTSSFWSSSSTSMSRDILLRPQPANKYNMDVSYIDNIYNVDLKATHRQSKRSRTIESLDWSICGR